MMTKFTILPMLILVFSTANFASASEYYDRQQAAREQSEQTEKENAVKYQIQHDLNLKKQIQIFARRHGGLANAGSCNSATITTCGFLAICVPKVPENLPISQLGTPGYDIGQCQATFNDGLACVLDDGSYNRWPYGDRRPNLDVSCYDQANKPHSYKQY